jgi:hypothetical protein
MVSLSAARGPAERERWAPSPQSLKCDVVRAANLVRSAIRPRGNCQMPRPAPPRRLTDRRQHEAGPRLEAAYRRRAPALRAPYDLAGAAIAGPQANEAVAVRTSASDSARVGREKRNHGVARGGGWEGKPPEDSQPSA